MLSDPTNSSEIFRNKFLSLPTKSEPKISQIQFLKSSRHSKEQQITKQIEDKVRQRYFPVLNNDKTFSTLKQQAQNDLFTSEVVRNNPKLQALLKKLHSTLIHSRVPQFYGFYFLKRLKDVKPQTFEDAINREINWIKERQCHYQLIEPTLKAREGCLKQLSRSLQNLQNNPTENGVYREFREQITHYRRLTTLVIKQIKQWKDYLTGLSENEFEDHPAFIYREEDYFLTLLNDNMFVFNSFLSKYVNFSQKNDPFFLRPHVNRFKQEKFAALFFVSEQQKQQYIGLLNYLAEQRARYLRKKVAIRTNRIREIQKIYHSRNKIQQSKSQIFMAIPQRSSTQNRMQYLQLKAQIDFVDDAHYQSRKNQLLQKQRKLQTMRKIKQMITTSHGVPLVSKNKIDLINQTQSKISTPIMTKTLLESQLKHSAQTDYDNDFSRMMRKKQVQVLEEAKDMRQLKWRRTRLQSNYTNYGTPVIRMSRSSSFRTIKIKDSLSQQRRTLNNKSCLNELESIVSTLQTTAPLQISRFKLNSKPLEEDSIEQQLSFKSPPKKLKKLEHTPSLIKHNDEVILNMRNRILKEIQSQQAGNLQIQMVKRLESQRVQAILQQKIEKQVLHHVNQQKYRRTEGRQEMSTDYDKHQAFAISSRVQNSKKLTHLEHELKKQFQLRLLREVHSQLKRKTQLSDIELYKMQQQEKLDIEAKRLAEKQQRQRRFMEIERQERAKAVKNLLELQDKRKKQLEQQMERIILQEKQKLQLFTLTTSKQVKNQLKEQVKQNMLKQLQYEKEIYHQNKLSQNEIKLRQEQYCQQVRTKLIHQYQIEDIVERQNQRQEKQRKQRMLEEKFQHFDEIIRKSKVQKNNVSNNIKNSIKNESLIIKTHHQTLSMEQARLKILQDQYLPIQRSQIEKYKKVQEGQKLKMRQEFEVQLFSFIKDQRLNMPQIQKSQKTFKVKNIQNITDDPEFLDKKQLQLKNSINFIHSKQAQIQLINSQKQPQPIHQNNFQSLPTTQNQYQNRPNSLINQDDPKQTQSSAFQRFSESMTLNLIKNQVLSNNNSQNEDKYDQNQQQIDQIQTKPQDDEADRLKLGMTLEEYQMYKKKKRLINKNRKSDENQFRKQKFVKHKKNLKKLVNEFELVEFNQQDSDDEEKNGDNKNYVNQIFERVTKSQKDKINQKKVFVFSNQSEVKPHTRGRSRRSRMSPFEKQPQDDSKGKILIKDMRTQGNKYGSNFEDNDSEVIKLTVHSHMESPGFQRNTKFMTSQEEGVQSGRALRKRRSERMARTRNKFHVGIKQTQNQQNQSSQSQLETLIQQQIQSKQQSRAKQTFVKAHQIKSPKLEQFIKEHFENMPRLIKRLNLYKRDELVKLLREDYKCFTVLEFIQNNESLGLGIVGLNEKKKGLRSFTILHIGPYDETDMIKLLLSFSHFLFKHDPLEEITLSLFYYSDIDDQVQFIKKFENQFADHGVMFQKNIFDTQFERKLVIRRTLAQKGPEEKENVNYGCFSFQSDLVVTKKFIGLQPGPISEAGHDFGSYGILSMYLAQHVSEQQLNKIIGEEKKEQKIRHLAKQSLSFKSSKQKICDGESYKLSKFLSAFEMNLELHKLERPLIKYRSDFQDQPVGCIWQNLRLDLELNYNLTAQKLKFMYEDDEYWGDYLRFVPLKTSKKKTYTIKSKLYSSCITVMPCRNSRYKLFVLSSQEYDNIKRERGKENEINLDIYIKLFLGNLSVHEIAEPEAIWLPQFNCKREYLCRQVVKEFQPESQSTLKSSMDFYYTTYLANSLIYESSHRELVITAPFILGVIDSQMQLASEGACLVVKRFGLEEIRGVRQVPKIIDED